MGANMGSMQVELKSAIQDLKINGEETMACQEKMETRLEGKEEPASEEMKPEVAQQEVPREDAAVMPIGGLRKQRRGRKQAAGRREKPKKVNRGICGSREKLAAACRKVSRHATVAWRKRNILRKSWTQRNCGLWKEVTAAGRRITRCAGHGHKGRKKEIIMGRNRIRRHEPKNERSKGIRSRDVEELLHLRKGRKTAKSIGVRSRRQQLQLKTIRNSGNKVFRRTMRLGIAKRIAGSPVAVQKIKKWTLWKGRPPPIRKKQH
jgi:hypothetical protein